MTEPATAEPVQYYGPAGGGLVFMAICFMLTALGFLIAGLRRLYSYSSLDDQIVGGDAYNYIILTNRGVGLIVAGAAVVLLACAFMLLAIRAQLAGYRR